MLNLSDIAPKVRVIVFTTTIIVVVVLLGLIINQVRTQPSKPIPPSLIESNTVDTLQVEDTITFSGELPKIPNKVPVYTGTANPDIQEISENLGSNLGLQPSIDNSYWYNPLTSEFLIYSKTNNQLNYNKKSVSSNAFINTETSLSVAQRFLDRLALDISLTPNKDTVKYYQLHNDEPHPEESVVEQANLVIFETTPTINNLPIVFGSTSFSAASVWVINNTEVIKFTLNPYVIPFEEYTQVTLINENTLKKRLETDQAEIIFINPEELTLNWESLKGVDLSTARLEYRFSPNTQFIYPYYRLSGTAMLNQTIPTEVEVIVPAY